MWRRFMRENRWYVAALGISLSVMLLCAYAFFGARSVEVTRTQNRARAESLNAAIVALPKVSSIVPAKTSGNTDFVATSRLNLAQQIPSQYGPQVAPWLYGFIPTYFASRDQQSEHTLVAKDAQIRLEKTAEHLTHLKKIIEYMPLVDLATPFGEDPGISERLSRTKQGLSEAIEYIRWSGLPHTHDINKQLGALNSQTLSLSDQTKAAWAADLLAVQTLIVRDIETGDIQTTDISEQLRAVAQSY